MARDELELRLHRATIPTDLTDPPRFSQLIETTKDAFVLELRRFFDRGQTTERLSELPTIDKYAIGYGATLDPYETTLQIVQDHPDVLEALPHIAVVAANGTNKRQTFGRPVIAQTQQLPRIETTNAEPYALADGERLVFQTRPDGITAQTHTILFRDFRFPTANPITAATAADVVRVINEQALYAHALVVDIGGGSLGLQLQPGGPCGGGHTPNEVEVLVGTSANVLTALGLTVGQRDDSTNVLRPPMNRYHHAAELIVNIDVVTEGANTRREVADLVYSWATFWLEQQHFELFGRSVFDESVVDEHYQIIVHQEVSFGAETSVPRPGGDAKDRVHIQRITVPVTTNWFIDRPVIVQSGPNTGLGWVTNSTDVVGIGTAVGEPNLAGQDLPIPGE